VFVFYSYCSYTTALNYINYQCQCHLGKDNSSVQCLWKDRSLHVFHTGNIFLWLNHNNFILSITGKFLSGCTIGSFSRRAQLHEWVSDFRLVMQPLPAKVLSSCSFVSGSYFTVSQLCFYSFCTCHIHSNFVIDILEPSGFSATTLWHFYCPFW
jgi:hypothetical protein